MLLAGLFLSVDQLLRCLPLFALERLILDLFLNLFILTGFGLASLSFNALTRAGNIPQCKKIKILGWADSFKIRLDQTGSKSRVSEFWDLQESVSK